MIAGAAGEIARAMGGRVVEGDSAVRVQGVSIDSRTVRAGELFFAIRGERTDGHDFAGAAAARGAPVIVLHQDAPRLSAGAVIRVDDTTAALGRLAAAERRRRRLRVVGVTGSSGKTTTRSLTHAALGVRYKAESSPGNLNNQWGLPLSLLRLPEDADAAILELGMNHRGEIAALTRIAAPDVGVITNVGEAHIGFLGSREEIAAAKAELLYELPADGVGVVHAGSPELQPHVKRCGRRVTRFGFEADADLVPRDLQGDLLRGASFSLNGVPVRLRLWGRHAALNATAALGAAQALGIPLATAASALAAVAPAEGRGRVLHLRGGVVLVDEVYNANPSAMEAILGELAATPWPGRRFAVLGDMRELGEFAPDRHRELGRMAARFGIGALIAVGEFARDVAAAAEQAGVREVRTAPDAEAAASLAVRAVTDGDLLVIKGSRLVQLERVRDAVVAARGEDRP